MTKYEVEGATYLQVELLQDYNRSSFMCKAMGAHLVEYTTKREFTAVSSALSLGLKKFWIGLNDFAKEGTFLWEHSGQDLSNFKKWRWLEPNNVNGEEHCVVQHLGVWLDISCDQKRYSICEF